MYCFLSGELTATLDSLEKYDVPISSKYYNTELARLFLKGRKVRFAQKYEMETPIKQVEDLICDFSGLKYKTDPIFENFGFCKNVSPEMIKKPEVNLILGINFIKPIWRKRK